MNHRGERSATALVDGVLLYTVGLMGLALVVPPTHGRVQGVATLIGSIVLIIVAFILGLLALIELLVMVSLFFAAPFGTIAYLAIWGFFPRGEAAAILSLLLLLKLAVCGFLVLAQQAFLKQKGLVAAHHVARVQRRSWPSSTASCPGPW